MKTPNLNFEWEHWYYQGLSLESPWHYQLEVEICKQNWIEMVILFHALETDFLNYMHMYLHICKWTICANPIIFKENLINLWYIWVINFII